MLLIEELQKRIADEQSLFRAQLLREDVARLAKLGELARSARYRSIQDGGAAHRLDARRYAHERARRGAGGLLEAVFVRTQNGTIDAGQEARIRDAWLELHRVRMERLVGCLSTPVPEPVE